jgi:hypothetical protein
MPEPLHYLHISDSHLGPKRDWTPLDNTLLYKNLERFVEAINARSPRPSYCRPAADCAGFSSATCTAIRRPFQNGILCTSVASTFCHLNLWPQDTETNFDTFQPPTFNFVTCHPDRTIVKSHTIRRT